MHIFRRIFSQHLLMTDLIFGHKRHIGTPYRGKRFLTRQIPTSCLPKSGGIIALAHSSSCFDLILVTNYFYF